MVLGIGVDVVEVARVGRALEKYRERLENRVFTAEERSDCAGRVDRVLALAARFAAKEACLKALGTGWAGGVSFRQIEVRREASGRPALRLHGRAAETAAGLGVTATHLSLSHQPNVAVAVVVLEGDPSPGS
jgi:holo-[acyl-carrier protein] synthase